MIPHLILIAPRFRVIDQFTAGLASTSTNVTRHQLVSKRCLLRQFLCITGMSLVSILVFP